MSLNKFRGFPNPDLVASSVVGVSPALCTGNRRVEEAAFNPAGIPTPACPQPRASVLFTDYNPRTSSFTREQGTYFHPLILNQPRHEEE